MSKALVIHVPTKSAQPAHIFNELCRSLGGVDPLWESNLFEEYVSNPWCKVPIHIKKRYGNRKGTGATVELKENGAVIASYEIEQTKKSPRPLDYNPIVSPTMSMPITPAIMAKKKSQGD